MDGASRRRAPAVRALRARAAAPALSVPARRGVSSGRADAARGGNRRISAGPSRAIRSTSSSRPAYTAPLGSAVAAGRDYPRHLVRRAPRVVPRARGRAAALADPPRRARGGRRLHRSPSSRGARSKRTSASSRPRIVVIPQGVTRRGTRDRRRRAREPLVLFVGSLFNRRRLPDLIAAFALATQDVPGARLVIVGGDRTWPPQDLAAVAAGHGVQPTNRVSTLRRRTTNWWTSMGGPRCSPFCPSTKASA